MALNLAALLGGLFTKAGSLAQSFAHYQKKLCDAARTEETLALLEVRSTMISCEKADAGLHSQPYQWLQEILLPPTDAVMHDYLQGGAQEGIVAQPPEPPGMFDDDPAVQGLFSEIVEAESGFESSMRELESDIRAEYDWPIGVNEGVVRLGQITLPLLEVGNPEREVAGVNEVIGADVLRERREGGLTRVGASIRAIEDGNP